MTAAPPAPPAAAAPALRYGVLPVHLLLDTTVGGPGGAAVAEVLPAVRDAWARHPALSDTLRLAAVDLAADAQVRLPLGDLLDPGLTLPALPLRRGTPGGGALATVRSAIEADVQGLVADGFAVHRPLLWIMVGTAPDGTWRAGLEELTASPIRPVVVACCFGAAAAENVRDGLRPDGEPLFLADATAPTAVAVAALTEVLTTVLVRTGHALGAEGAVLLPTEDELPAAVTRAGTAAPDDDGQGDQDVVVTPGGTT